MTYEESLEAILIRLKRFGLEQYFEIIKSLALPAYKISSGIKNQERDEILSKIGGKPNLPKSFTWPKYEFGSMAFLAQINLEKLPELPDNIANLKLPKTGLFSIFLPLKAHLEYSAAEMAEQCQPLIFHFNDLTKLSSRDFPDDLYAKTEVEETDFVIVGTEQIPNPDFDPKRHTLTPPVLKPDPDGSFTTYFAALEVYGRSKDIYGVSLSLRQSNPEFIEKPILEKQTYTTTKTMDLIFDEEILELEPFASFPFWGNIDLFCKAGIPESEIEKVEAWQTWWRDINKYTGSNMLGYAQSIQYINHKYMTEEATKHYNLFHDFTQNFWHLISFSWDFEDNFQSTSLGDTNNFYLFQKDRLELDLSHVWIDINTD